MSSHYISQVLIKNVNNNKNNLVEDQLWNERKKKRGGHRSRRIDSFSFFFSSSLISLLSLSIKTPPPYIYIVGTHARVHPACLLQQQSGLGTLSLSLFLWILFPPSTPRYRLYKPKIVIIERDYSHMNMNGRKIFFFFLTGGKSFYKKK